MPSHRFANRWFILAVTLTVAAPGTAPAARPAKTNSSAWKAVDKLLEEQKLEAAASEVAKIRAAASSAGNEVEATRAMLKEVELRMGLNGYETALRFLQEQPRPKAAFEGVVVDLFYAQALMQYLQAYSWEIRQREKVEARAPLDLKQWTAQQIFAEATKAYQAAWQQRATLGEEPLSRLSNYLNPGNYPAEIRGTLRDALSYLAVGLLANTAQWTPLESSEVYRLDLKQLLSGQPGDPSKPVRLDDASIHPLVRVVAVLDDLAAWHHGRKQEGAALEAHLQRLSHLHESFKEAAARESIIKDLRARLPGYRQVSWWAEGMAVLAEMLESDRPVAAHEIATQGYQAYPKSSGGSHCNHIARAIEQPYFSLAAMENDSAGRRSLQITHQNLPALYFRAYKFDLADRVKTANPYNYLPGDTELDLIMAGGRPVAEWKVALPATPDFRRHQTFAVPALHEQGAYLIYASADARFSKNNNNIKAVHYVIGNLILVTRQLTSGELEVTALHGESGRPVEGVDVELYRANWDGERTKVAGQKSNKAGLVNFTAQSSNHWFFVIAHHGNDFAFDLSQRWLNQKSPPTPISASLIYTDRSIYRPNQTIHWKVIAYGGKPDGASYKVAPDERLTVTLHDANGEKVAQQDVVTNSFGTVAGEFLIPSGRLLGNWRIRTSLQGQAVVIVDEYKRPTFEASIKDPQGALRLNHPVTLTGEARYYFGLPVSSGQVRWHIERRSQYPCWWGYFWALPSQAAERVASGETKLASDGTFSVNFTPAANENQAGAKDITYSYQLSADITDEGGETRSASTTFHLGFVAMETTLSTEAAFQLEKTAFSVVAMRHNLSGAPQPGQATWRLLTLKQPQQALLPSEQPLSAPPENCSQCEPRSSTPGDQQRPRWDSSYQPSAILASWSDGAVQAQGELMHDAQGKAQVALPGLAAGVYRLRYQALDAFGVKYETWQDIIVAAREPGKTPLALPIFLELEKTSVAVGEKIRLFAHAGLPGETLFLEKQRNGAVIERRTITQGQDGIIEFSVGEDDRGGCVFQLTALRDHQYMKLWQNIFVPWDSKKLKIDFATFRDHLRPGARETWRITVRGPSGAVEAGSAEILAYMYDRSLDLFAQHRPPSLLSLYPSRISLINEKVSLNWNHGQLVFNRNWGEIPQYTAPDKTSLQWSNYYGAGGMGNYSGRGPRMKMMAMPPPSPSAMPSPAKPSAVTSTVAADTATSYKEKEAASDDQSADQQAAAPAGEIRSNFAETAFWQPSLLTNKDGAVTIEFQAPDSVTAWNFWVHALTRDLRSASAVKEVHTVKELMVRPYLPRFFREGDEAELKVVVNNASEREMRGTLTLEILDAETQSNITQSFGVQQTTLPFVAPAGRGSNIGYLLNIPKKVGQVAFRVTARAGDFSDGELRPLPILPSRYHLAQSRFVTLRDKDSRTMFFADLAKGDDPTLLNESMVVTLDAQLFFTVLKALPYLIEYPYECVEQTLNRFVSTGIVTSIYRDFPALAKMAEGFAKRSTPLEKFDAPDPNRKMALEESPWLAEAKGGEEKLPVINVLDPQIARAQRVDALEKLKKSQTSSGAFPWFSGGPPSPFMTLYLMHGLARATEFGIEVPKDMVTRGWSYLARHFRDEYLKKLSQKKADWEFLTLLNYVASSYPDATWTGSALTASERQTILEYSFARWKKHSPYLKALLALTLKRMGREKDAILVFESVMDSAKTAPDQGTFWAQEDRSWLWYNDTIESHAFALRTLTELMPAHPKRDGLVLWLLLNKKLSHWKSTRATAEVIYSLAHYMKREGTLAIREDATVSLGGTEHHFTFEPDKYVGKTQVVLPGEKVGPRTATVEVSKQSKGIMFASTTWNFSTEKLPAESRGDFFQVSRQYFKRETVGQSVVLKPLTEGTPLAVGDQIEVQLALRTKHAAEYVHLRDPRAAGLEPESPVSRYHWDLGIVWYEEVRDSGSNFFFEQLPVGEYTFKYRLRANMAGKFRVGPATVQSMYAPEFNAYSAGNLMIIKPAK